MLWACFLGLCFKHVFWAYALGVCFEHTLWACVLRVCFARIFWAYALGICFEYMALESMSLGTSLWLRGFGRMSLGV